MGRLAFLARLQAWADRPLPDSTGRLMLLTGAVLALLGGGLIALRSVVPPPQPRVTDAPPATQAPAPTPTPARREHAGHTLAPKELRRARRAARSFLHGYLAYSYGRLDASRIRSATTGLRAQLAADPPRVPARERRRRARVDVLQAQSMATDRVEILAVVVDGKRTYSLRVALELGDGAWRAVAVGQE